MVFFGVTIATGATPTVTILKMPPPFVQVSLCVRVYESVRVVGVGICGSIRE